MSDNRCIKYREEEEDEEQNKEIFDEECDKAKKKQLRIGAQKATGKDKRGGTKQPKVKLASVKVDVLDSVNMIDTYDREAKAFTETNYARSGTYAAGLTNEPGERIPKIGAFAEAGTGRARAEYSVFEAEAKGPNASAGVEASVLGVGAMARAEVVSASAKAGPLNAKVGLGVDTGASIGLGGVEAKFLGTGFSAGPTGVGVSLLGSEVKLSCAVM